MSLMTAIQHARLPLPLILFHIFDVFKNVKILTGKKKKKTRQGK